LSGEHINAHWASCFFLFYHYIRPFHYFVSISINIYCFIYYVYYIE